MDVQAFKTKLFEKGREAGFADMEIYYQASRNTTVRVFRGDIDAYNISEAGGLSFRGLIGGKMGSAFTEKLDDDSIALLLREAQENAEIIDSAEAEELFGGSESYAEIASSSALAETEPDRLIGAAMQMERVALEADPRIDVVNSCSVSKGVGEVTISNTKGLDCHFTRASAVCSVSAVAKVGEDITSASESAFTRSEFGKCDPEAVARSAANQAVQKLGSQSIESQAYTVILRNNAAADLLQNYASIFSGEAAEKGLSLLQGRIGEQVAGGNITVIDDPHMPEGPGSMPFDAEGVATQKHEVIKDGKLLTFLHNRKSAAKANVNSTGNAYKASYRASLGVSPSNLYIAPGEQLLDEMIAGTERGILIVELQGLHAGTNAVSGDFSLFCIGFMIENGAIVRPVSQITVAGNFLEMLCEVEAIGNDLRFSAYGGYGSGSCASPSLKIRSLAIAGK